MKYKFLFLLSFVFGMISFSQNESRVWYFGNQAGLDFSTSPPTILTNGMLNTTEGCASISDATGNLLFYTDGVTIYNKNHLVMANGNGLAGNGSSTQSAIIVKQPGNSNIYYVFTQWPSSGVRYSIVDMNLAAGLGSVTVLNTTLSPTPTTEKLTSVRHCNGVDTWVLTHLNSSNQFLAYLLTATGVNPIAVNSAIGTVHNGVIGHMKVSPNGKKLAVGIYGPQQFELYDFDNSTGVVSNSLVLGTFQFPYGIEFSPDCSKLYGSIEVGNGLPIYQWDLCAGSATAIIASQSTIGLGQGAAEHGALQLGPDGKIYVCRYLESTIGVINNPNALGAACNYNALGQSIAPKVCTLGFPNFISSYFKMPAQPFTHTIVGCQSASFTAVTASNPSLSGCSAAGTTLNGMSWNFGDPGSGAANTSTLTNPFHTFTGPGSYTTVLVLNYNCSSDTVKQVINITNSAPTVSISGKTSICVGQTATLSATGANTYSWTKPVGGGAITSTIVVTPTVTSTYTLTGTNTVTGCAATKLYTLTVNKCAAVGELPEDNNFKIYPNPVNKHVFIETEKSVKVFLYNELGSLILEKQLEGGKHLIDLSYLASGVYILKSVSNSSTQTLRLIKTD